MLSRRDILKMVVPLPIAGFWLGNGYAGPARRHLEGLQPAEEAVVEAFMAAIRSRSAAARAGFAKRYVSQRAGAGPATWLRTMEHISAEAPGLTLLSARGGRTLQLLVRTPRGRVAGINLIRDPREPGHFIAIDVMPLPARYPDAGRSGQLSPMALAKGIERRLEFAVERGDFSGAVRVVKGSEVIFENAYGDRNRRRGRRNALVTRFNFGSVGKMFTSVCIGQLIERGQLTLNSRLIELLPDYPNASAARKISIRELLTHSAGLGSLFDRANFSARLHFNSMTELLPVFASAPLAFEPGTATAYSNEGFVVLGAVVEPLSGQDWYEYVAEHVFAKAGMKDTAFPTLEELRANQELYAVGYTWADNDPLGLAERQANWSKSLAWRGQSSGGGYSTVADLTTFMTALHDGTLLDSKLADLFTFPAHVGPKGADLGPPDVGMDFECRSGPRHHTLRGHRGGAPGVNADVEIVWETGYAYAAVSNFDPPAADAIGQDIGAMLMWQRS
jgi:D-alanyl-D-alanine carboxypeptidase